VVAYPHKLVATREANSAVVPSLPVIGGLISAKDGKIRIQTGDSIKLLSGGSFRLDSAFHSNGAFLYGDGTSLFLRANPGPKEVRFDAVRTDGKTLHLFSVPGKFLLASWNELGLATIIDNSLVTWRQGASSVSVMATDPALGKARSACLVGDDKVVVTLRNMVVMYSQGRRTILVGMRARCTWTGTGLFLLDERRGFVWKLSGIEDVGNPQKTEIYIDRLISTAATSESPQESSTFLEAARFVGCREASRRLGAQQKPVSR
jgi:hypothetical protein